MTPSLDLILEQHAGREGPLLPILHDVQAEFGHISEAAIRSIASMAWSASTMILKPWPITAQC
jgi:NADH:ubiquinone oxidoreductase subunit E